MRKQSGYLQKLREFKRMGLYRDNSKVAQPKGAPPNDEIDETNERRHQAGARNLVPVHFVSQVEEDIRAHRVANELGIALDELALPATVRHWNRTWEAWVAEPSSRQLAEKYARASIAMSLPFYDDEGVDRGAAGWMGWAETITAPA
jgi:hypothetical protein